MCVCVCGLPKPWTELVVYICLIKNYTCQFIKRTIWMYCNILQKKCEKIDNQCYATSNISCLSLVHIVLLVTILWGVFYMFGFKKNFLDEKSVTWSILVILFARRKLDVTLHPFSCQITNILKFCAQFLILWVIQDVAHNSYGTLICTLTGIAL